MIIYGALFIPILVCIVLFFMYRHKTVWWEFLIPLLASLIMIVTSKAIIEYVSVQSKEYWGSFISKIEYYEDWNEWIEQTCTRTCCCDSKGQNCGTETYDCSYCLYHPAKYIITTTTGEEISVDATEYARVKAKIGNERFTELNRDYYTDDGNLYTCTWNNDSAKAIPVTTEHYYENRVKAADQSVFHFNKVSEDDVAKYDLKEYPEIKGYYSMDAVLGDSSTDAAIANYKLNYANALLGHSKEVRIFLLVFKNQPIEAGLYQEWYWQGANMNEFVVCIGTDNDRNVKWCHPISWTTNELLKAEIKSYVNGLPKLSLFKVSDYLRTKVADGFQRRDFKEFDYLTVEPSTTATVITYILTLLLNVALSFWIINNEFEESESEDITAETYSSPKIWSVQGLLNHLRNIYRP